MAYHQSGGRIEIVIRKDNGLSTAGANEIETTGVSAEDMATTADTTAGGRGRNYKQTRALILATHTTAVAHQVFDLTMEYVHSGIGVRNGDQAMQQQVQRKVEKFQDYSNLATSIAMGMAYGVHGGPMGIVVGGVLGLVRSGYSTAMKYATRQREFDFKIFKENNAIEYSRARAGVNWTSGRLR